MKKIAIGILAMLGACGGSSGYSASYSGSLTETYTCANSSPPAFQLSNEILQIDVDGANNATITLASCPGDTIYGVQTSNTEIDLTQSNTFSCNQVDAAGDSIVITSIGGTLTFDGNALDVNLTETATIDSDSCGGVASGQLE